MMETPGTEPAAPAAPDSSYAPPGPAIEEVASLREAVLAEVRKAIVGQDEAQELMLIGLLAGGHVLLEGVPGTGQDAPRCKTCAEALGADVRAHPVHARPDARRHHRHQRLQTRTSRRVRASRRARSSPTCCSPTRSTARRPRRSPRCWRPCRSAQVTIDGMTLRARPPLHSCFATQNPIEFEGTYPLPEAQLDRFLFKVVVDYPTPRRRTASSLRTTRGFDPTPDPAGLRERRRLQRHHGARARRARVT